MVADLNLIFGIAMTTALAIIGYLIKTIFDHLKTRVKEVDERSINIEKNYIRKWDETNRNIIDVGDRITKRLDERIEHLTDNLSDNYVTKEYCELMHKNILLLEKKP